MLIAEDEILIRLDIVDTLREQGWEVVETGTAEDALAVLVNRHRTFTPWRCGRKLGLIGDSSCIRTKTA